MNEELKPCPFCGGKAAVAVVSEYSDCAGWRYVVCTNVECLVRPQTLHCYEEKADAVKAWNRRAEMEVKNG